MVSQPSPGQVLAAQLSASLSAYQMGPVVGDHARQVLWGVTPDGSFVGGMTLDGFLARAGQTLLDCGRAYVYGNTVVYEADGPGGRRLTTLAVQHRAEPNAPNVLANLVAAAHESRQGVVQSVVPSKLVNAVLADESLWRRLPEIRYHARRPTFDAEFNLCHPGWNPGAGILVHFGEVVPTTPPPAHAADSGAVDRLPPLLAALFGEFAWRSDADLVNALAMLLTGLLINHFVDDPHPGGLVDANQPGTGKTLFVQVTGRILDGEEPPRVPLARDEELEKRFFAQLRGSRTGLFFVDNVRSRIESAVVEQNMLSPLLSFRILGRSATIERPNTYLWMITSNMTAGTPDFIRRCVPIRLFFEGDPKARAFTGNPLAYATGHRLGLLGELAGMVLHWVHQGKPAGPHKHRCDRWAAVVGGILGANGLGGFFLANAEEAESEMDQGLVDLATLAELAASKGLADLHVPAGADPVGKGRTPGQWVPLFAEASVLRDKFVDAGAKGKATAAGVFLSGKVNRAVPVETAEGPRTATLRRRGAGAGQKLYYFEVAAPGSSNGPGTYPPLEAVETSLPILNGDGPTPAPGVADDSGDPLVVSPQTPEPTHAPAADNGVTAGSTLEWV